MIPLNKFDYAPNAHNALDWQHAIEEQLVVLDGICREHGLKYSLAFGGLLGAIRHRGMIPWDNDADIVMFEEDYLKLRQLSNDGLLPEGYRLVDRSVEDDYSLLFGRFINENTSCPLSTSSFNGGANGVFIDVFILFPVPEEPDAQVDCITDFLVWEEMQCHIKRRSKFRSALFCERWAQAKKVETQHGRAFALDWCEKRFRAKMPAVSRKCIHGSGGAYQGYPVLDTAWFERPVYKPFGSHEFAVPNGYLSFFRRFYGNSWRMFPEGERFHAYSAACLNVPGSQLVQDYMQFIDQQQAVADFDALKQLKMEEMRVQSKRNPEWWGMKGALQADVLNKEFASKLKAYRKTFTREAVAAPDLDLDAMAAVCEETDIIIRYQTCSRMRTWRVAMPFKPLLLSAALWSRYLTRADYWKVEKVIACQRVDRKHCVLGGSELDRLLQQALDATGDLYEAIDRADEQTVAANTAVLDRICPASLHAQVGHAYALWCVAVADPSQAIDSFKAIQGMRRRWADNEYLQLFALECAWIAGRAEDAQTLAGQIAASCMNGMVLLACHDFCAEHNVPFKQRDLSRIPEPPVVEGKRKITFPSFHSVKGGFMITRANMQDHMKEQSAALKRAQANLKPLTDATEHYRTLRRLTSNRFQTWERVYPRKQALLSAARAGKMDEVARYADEYIRGIYHIFDDDHLGLCVDWDMLQACLPLLNQARGQDFVDEYLSLIPEPHKENMDAWMRRVGIDHPYLHQTFPAGEYD